MTEPGSMWQRETVSRVKTAYTCELSRAVTDELISWWRPMTRVKPPQLDTSRSTATITVFTSTGPGTHDCCCCATNNTRKTMTPDRDWGLNRDFVPSCWQTWKKIFKIFCVRSVAFVTSPQATTSYMTYLFCLHLLKRKLKWFGLIRLCQTKV